ncbi:MAG TPA: glycosyl hydrolase family 28-related protein [Microcella sp.]|nr:glycosyl hydrolase family 28-related protein [Microcella sp.]
MACEDTRQLTEAQRVAGYLQQRTGVQQAVRPFTGRPTLDNLLDYINRELVPAVRQTRNAVNETYNQVRDNAPSGNPLQFYFSTETANADPTTGFIRLDAATQDTATTIRVSQTNGRLQDVAAWLDVMAGGATTPLGTITLFDAINPGRFLRFDLDTMADQGAYWDLGVTIIESSHDSPFVQDGAVAVSFIPGVASSGVTVPPTAITPVAANTVIANATAAPAAPTAVAVGTNTVLGRVAGNIVAAQLVNAQVTDATLANAKLANMVEATIKGRAAGAGAGAPTDLTAAELAAILAAASWGEVEETGAGPHSNYAIGANRHIMASNAAGVFTGFASGVAGRVLVVSHQGTGYTEFQHNTTSTTTNRIFTGRQGRNIRISDNEMALFVYADVTAGSGTTSAWVLVAPYPPFAVASNSVTGDVNVFNGSNYVPVTPSGGRQFLGTNTAGTAVSYQTLSLLFPGAPIYDVMAPPFNAVGNGVADDTAAINAAIAAANSTAGTIYFGNHHRITAALTPITASSVRLRGRGQFNGGTVISVDAAAADDWITVDGAQYVAIEDFWIRGVGALYTTGAAIRLYGAFRIYIDRVLITQLGVGIDIESSGPVEIHDVTISDIYGAAGIWMHGSVAGVAHAMEIVRVNVSTSMPDSVVGFTQDWQPSTAYSVGNAVVVNGNIYQAVTGGTSAGSGGPSGVPGSTTTDAHTATITDGTVEWVWAMSQYTAFLIEEYTSTIRILDSGALQGAYGIRMVDGSGGANAPAFLRCVNVEFDHVSTAAISLEGGGQAEFEQTFVTSMLNGPAIQILDTFDGLWRFNGGVLFASGVELVTIAAPYGVMSNMVISGGGLFGANTYDAVRVDANTTHFQIVDCSISASPGDTNPDTRYGISIASGCDNFVVQGNNLIGHDTGAVLNTPGGATTRLVRNNIPDVQVLEVEETGAGPFNDYDSGGARHIMASNTAGVFTGFIAGAIGDLLLVSHQGSGYTEIQHNTGSANANRVLTGRAGKSLRLHDNEVATFRYVDTAAGGTLGSRWVLVAPLFPFALASDAATGDVLAFTGTDWSVVSGGNNANVVLRGDAAFGTVSNAALSTMSSPRLKGRTTSGTGAVEDLTLTTTATVTPNTATGGAIGFDVPNDAVTNAILANMVEATIKGRAAGAGTGDPSDLTATQVAAILASANWGEAEETGATLNDYAIGTNRHIMCSNAAGVVTGFASGVAGRLLVVSHQGTGYTEFAHNSGSSTSGNRIFTGRLGSTVRIRDNEVAVFVYADITAGAGTTSAWVLVAPQPPFMTSTANAAGDALAHDGTNWVVAAGGNSADVVLRGNATFGTVSLAAMANLAQSTIIGRAEGAGTGVPTALTPTQVAAIIDGENVTWTGTHTFNGGSVTANVGTADILLGANPGGIGLFSGQATANVTNGDLVLNSASGIAINASGTAVTSVATGAVEVTGTAIGLTSTGDTTIVAGGVLTLAATTQVQATSPFLANQFQANGLMQWNGIISPTISADQNNWSPTGLGAANVIRVTASGAARTITGIAGGASGRVLVIINVGTSFAVTLAGESASSTAANRIIALNEAEAEQLGLGHSSVLWYDSTSERWRIIARYP